MTQFEFVFSLFGLLLGLSLAEVLGGAVRTVKARGRVRIGWLTPLLGLFVMLDLVTFWDAAWTDRDRIPLHYGSLVAGLGLTGLYYFVASLVFPDRPEEWPDLDVYYFEHKRQVLAGIAIVNVLVIGAATIANPELRLMPTALIIQFLYFALLAIAWAARGPRANIWALGGLIGIYLFIALMTALMPAPAAAGGG